MPKIISDITFAKVPSFANRVSLFQSMSQITRHTPGNITDYCHALYKAVAYVGKLPEEFTKLDADGYMLHPLSFHVLPPTYVCIRHYGLLLPSIRDKL